MSEYSTISKGTSGPVFQKLPVECRFPINSSDKACLTFDLLCDWLRTWSPRSDNSYYEAVALFILSTIAARRVSYSFGGIRYTNLQILLIGRTGISAKTTVATLSRDLLTQLGLDFLLVPDIITPQKLVNIMTRNKPENYEKLTNDEQLKAKLSIGYSGQRGWLHDEFGTTLSGMMQNQGTDTMLRKIFRQFDDSPSKFSLAGIARGTDEIINTYLAFLGCMTVKDIEPFCKNNATLWGDGWLARMAIVSSEDVLKKNARFPKGNRTYPEDLLLNLSQWHLRLGLPTVTINTELHVDPAKGHHLVIDKAVEEACYAYDQALLTMIEQWDSYDLDGNYVRFPEKAMRIAALFASLAGSDHINIAHWAKAQGITEQWRENLHSFYQRIVTNTAPRKVSNMERVMRTMSVKETPTKREIEQHTGLLSYEVQDQLDILLSRGDIKEIEAGNTVRYTRSYGGFSPPGVDRRSVDRRQLNVDQNIQSNRTQEVSHEQKWE